MISGHDFDVLVCFADADRQAARSLLERLDAAELQIRLAQEQLGPGDIVVEKVRQAPGQSRYVLLLICLSAAVVGSSSAQRELAAVVREQLATGDKPVVPLLLTACAEVEIPHCLRGLQRIDLRREPGLGPAEAAPAAGVPAAARQLRLGLRRLDAGLEARWLTPDGPGSPWLIDSPITADYAAEHRWYTEQFLRYPGAGDRDRARQIERQLEAWGDKLYQALDRPAGSLRELMQHDGRRSLTIVSSAADVLALPWELLRDGQGPLACRDLVIRRQLPDAAEPAQRSLGLPLRVLLLVSRPVDVATLDTRSSLGSVLAVQRQLAGQVTVELCVPPSLAELTRRLTRASQAGSGYHVIHFDGPAVADLTPGAGALCFEGDDGRQDPVPAAKLGDLLVRMAVPLALLQACQIPRADSPQAPILGWVAPALLQSGVGSVLLIPHTMTVTAARILLAHLYGSLAEGDTVGRALSRGRAALQSSAERLRLADGTAVQLRDWHLPQLYQIGADPVLRPAAEPAALRPGRAPSRSFGPAPAYGFHGRARELHELQRRLLSFPAVVVTGPAGIGKTSLAREAARWWTSTGRRPDGAVRFSFASRQGADRAIEQLGSYLEGEAFTSLPAEERWHRAVQLFHERQVLWVWDSFERTLPAYQKGRTKGTAFADEERQRLAELYRDLVGGEPQGWLLLTCRCAQTGLPGTGELPLGGLWPEDSLELAATLLQHRAIVIGSAGYERQPLEELVEVLDHHPLALSLVSGHLDQMPPAAVQRDLRAQLAELTGARVDEGCSRSLLASLTFAARRLSEPAQTALACLAWFDGGAFEQLISDISGLAEDDWSAGRQELLATGLVSAEAALQINDRPYLRFHSALDQVRATGTILDGEQIRQRFVSVYLKLAAGLYRSLSGDGTVGARAVAELEEANLRKAAELAFERGLCRQGWTIANTVGRYLACAGRPRDRARFTSWVEGQMCQAAPPAEIDDVASLAAVREQAWGLFIEGKTRQAVELLVPVVRRLESPAAEAQGRDVQLARCRLQLGRMLDLAEQPRLAVKPLAKAIEAFAELGELDNLSTALGYQANALVSLGHHRQALVVAEGSLQIDRDSGDLRSEALSLGQIAEILTEMHRWSEACQRYEEALAAARRAADARLEVSLLLHLAGLLGDRGEHASAVERYQQALALFQQLGDAVSEMQTYDMLGITEEALGHYAAALSWHERSRELARKLGNRRQLANAVHNLAILRHSQAKALPDDSQAERRRLLGLSLGLMEESLAIEQEMGNEPGRAASLSQLGRLHRRLGNLDEAERFSTEAMEIHESLDLPNVYKDYWNLERIAGARGDEAAAAAWRAKKEAKQAELEQLRSQGSPVAVVGLAEWLTEELTDVARRVYQVRVSGGPLPPDLAEGLERLAGSPEPLGAAGRFIRAVALGEPPAELPAGLGGEQAQVLTALVNALQSAGS